MLPVCSQIYTNVNGLKKLNEDKDMGKNKLKGVPKGE